MSTKIFENSEKSEQFLCLICRKEGAIHEKKALVRHPQTVYVRPTNFHDMGHALIVQPRPHNDTGGSTDSESSAVVTGYYGIRQRVTRIRVDHRYC